MRFRGGKDNEDSPFSNSLPRCFFDFANSSRLSIGNNAYKLLKGCQRAIHDHQCPTIHNEKISLFKYDNGDIGIVLSNGVSASMAKRKKYYSSVAVTRKCLVAARCKQCRIGNKEDDGRTVCIHNLPLVFGVSLLFYDGFAQHLLIELANRWDHDIEKFVDKDVGIELKKGIKALMRSAGIDENKIHELACSPTIDKMLSEFSVGTEKSKMRFIPKPTENEVMPLRCMKFTSSSKKSVDRMLGSGGNILIEATNDGEEDILLSATLDVTSSIKDNKNKSSSAHVKMEKTKKRKTDKDIRLYMMGESLFCVEDETSESFSSYSLQHLSQRKTKTKPMRNRICSLSREKVKMMKPGIWLNDKCINYYMDLLTRDKSM